MKISLKAARVNAGMTQNEAARKAGVSKSSIINWEKGKTFPTATKMMELCKLYCVTMDDIFLIEK